MGSSLSKISGQLQAGFSLPVNPRTEPLLEVRMLYQLVERICADSRHARCASAVPATGRGTIEGGNVIMGGGGPALIDGQSFIPG